MKRSPELYFLGDFKVRNSSWLKYSSHTYSSGWDADVFAITHDICQLLREPICSLENVNHHRNVLDIFLLLIDKLFAIPTNTIISHQESDYNLTNWRYIRDFYGVFPWKQESFRLKGQQSSTQSVTDIVKIDIKCYILNCLNWTKNGKPWCTVKSQ